MTVLKTLIRRELQEHKWALIYLPWIVALGMSIFIVLIYIGITEIDTENFKFSTNIFSEPAFKQGMLESTPEQREAAMRAGLLVFGFPLVMALGFAILAFSLSTFYDERKDKSIIFWRSMPVSDTFTVFSKLVVALFIAPLLIIPPLLVLHLVTVTASSIYFSISDMAPFFWVWTAYPYLDWIRTIFSLWIQSFWSLPIITWIMLAGAYSRKPIIAAVLPPVVLAVLDTSGTFFTLFMDRLQPWSRTNSFPKEYQNLRVAEIDDIPLLFSMNEFWIGIIIGGIFIALTIYFRRNSDYSTVE